MKKGLKKFIRGTALVTLITYLPTNISYAAPAFSSPPEINFPQSWQFTQSLAMTLPAKLGRIESFHPGSKGTILHIQTAHGHYEAQRKIEKLLQTLSKKYGDYPILVEGAAEKLNPDLLKFFKNNSARNYLAAKWLTKKALVKGPELYLLDHPSAQGYGIEDANAYRKNHRQFTQVLKAQKESRIASESFDLKIEKLAAASFSSELRAFLKRLEQRELNIVSFELWISELQKAAQKNLKIDLTDAAWQLHWPMLVRFFKIQKMSKEFSAEKYENEKNNFLKNIKKELSSARDTQLFDRIKQLLDSAGQSIQLPEPETENVFVEMLRRLPKDFDFKAYPQVTRFVGLLVLQSELRPALLSAEIERLENLIANKLARTEKEKNILEIFNQVRLLKKLLALQLTPDDFEKVGASQTNIRPSEIMKRLNAQRLPQNGAQPARALNTDPFAELDQVYDNAVAFYRGAQTRDQAMIHRMEERLRSNPSKFAVVVTGGFHTSAMRNYFENKGYSYAVVTPSISGMDEQGYKAYLKAMLQTESDSKTISNNMIELAYGTDVLGTSTHFDQVVALAGVARKGVFARSENRSGKAEYFGRAHRFPTKSATPQSVAVEVITAASPKQLKVQAGLEGRRPYKPGMLRRSELRNDLEGTAAAYLERLSVFSKNQARWDDVDGFMLVGNPDLLTFLKFIEQWKLASIHYGSKPIFIAGGKGRGTIPLLKAVVAHLQLRPQSSVVYRKIDGTTGSYDFSKLPESFSSFDQIPLYESEILGFLLENSGIDPEWIHVENKPSKNTQENFSNLAPIVNPVFAGKKQANQPVILGLVTAPYLERRAVLVGKETLGDPTQVHENSRFQITPFPTYEKVDLEKLTDAQLIELLGYVLGYPDVIQSETINRFKETDGIRDFLKLTDVGLPRVLGQDIGKVISEADQAFEAFVQSLIKAGYAFTIDPLAKAAYLTRSELRVTDEVIQELANETVAARSAGVTTTLGVRTFNFTPLATDTESDLVLLVKPTTGTIQPATIVEILKAARERGYYAHAVKIVAPRDTQAIMPKHYLRHAEVAEKGLNALNVGELQAVTKHLLFLRDRGERFANFESTFSVSDLMRLSKISPRELAKIWDEAFKASVPELRPKKLMDGARAFRIAPVTLPNNDSIAEDFRGKTVMVFNGFYPAFAADFTESPDATVAMWLRPIQGAKRVDSLPVMKADFAGDTDPAKASPNSLRGRAFRKDLALQLSSEYSPTLQANFIHLTDPADIAAWKNGEGEFAAWFGAAARSELRDLKAVVIGKGSFQENVQSVTVAGQSITQIEDKPDLGAFVAVLGQHDIIYLDPTISREQETDYEGFVSRLNGLAMQLGSALRILRDGGNKDRKVIILRGLVSPGTTAKIYDVIKWNAQPKDQGGGKFEDMNFDVVFQPDFSLPAPTNQAVEGQIIFGQLEHALKSDQLEATRAILNRFLNGKSIEFMDDNSAELAKEMQLIYLAAKLAHFDDVAELSRRYGADLSAAAFGAGLDKRIQTLFTNPSLGFGGRLFVYLRWVRAMRLAEAVDSLEGRITKVGLDDTAKREGKRREIEAKLEKALDAFEAGRDIPSVMRDLPNELHMLFLIDTILRINKQNIIDFSDLIAREAKVNGGSLRGKKVTLLGVGYSPQANQVGDNPTLLLIDQLIAQGVTEFFVADINTVESFKVWLEKKRQRDTKYRGVHFHWNDAAGAHFSVENGNFYSAISQGDLAIIATESNPDLHRLDLQQLAQALNGKPLFDGVNMFGLRANGSKPYPLEGVRSAGINLIGVGRRNLGPRYDALAESAHGPNYRLSDSDVVSTLTEYDTAILARGAPDFAPKQVAMIGGGYVGLVTAANLAAQGHSVHVVDLKSRQKQIDALQGPETETPIYEPGLREMIIAGKDEKRIQFSTEKEKAIRTASVVYLAVGTPSQDNGQVDLQYILQAARDIGEVILANRGQRKTIVIKSTVTPNTFEEMNKVLTSMGLELGRDYALVSNPEFLREGSAIEDVTKPDRTVLGFYTAMTPEVRREVEKQMLELWRPLMEKHPHQVLLTDTGSSTIIKYLANSFLAISITLANLFAEEADRIEADFVKSRMPMFADPRIGRAAFLWPGCGYGGSCFPKDVLALAFSSNAETGHPLPMIALATQFNQAFKLATVTSAVNLAAQFPKAAEPLKDKDVVLLGMAFKPETDDMRESSAVTILYELLKKGAGHVRVHDPIFNVPNAPKREVVIDHFLDYLFKMFSENDEFNVAFTQFKGVTRAEDNGVSPALRLELAKNESPFAKILYFKEIYFLNNFIKTGRVRFEDKIENLGKADLIILATDWKTKKTPEGQTFYRGYNDLNFEEFRAPNRELAILDGRNLWHGRIPEIVRAGITYSGIGTRGAVIAAQRRLEAQQQAASATVPPTPNRSEMRVDPWREIQTVARSMDQAVSGWEATRTRFKELMLKLAGALSFFGISFFLAWKYGPREVESFAIASVVLTLQVLGVVAIAALLVAIYNKATGNGQDFEMATLANDLLQLRARNGQGSEWRDARRDAVHAAFQRLANSPNPTAKRVGELGLEAIARLGQLRSEMRLGDMITTSDLKHVVEVNLVKIRDPENFRQVDLGDPHWRDITAPAGFRFDVENGRGKNVEGLTGALLVAVKIRALLQTANSQASATNKEIAVKSAIRLFTLNYELLAPFREVAKAKDPKIEPLPQEIQKSFLEVFGDDEKLLLSGKMGGTTIGWNLSSRWGILDWRVEQPTHVDAQGRKLSGEPLTVIEGRGLSANSLQSIMARAVSPMAEFYHRKVRVGKRDVELAPLIKGYVLSAPGWFDQKGTLIARQENIAHMPAGYRFDDLQSPLSIPDTLLKQHSIHLLGRTVHDGTAHGMGEMNSLYGTGVETFEYFGQGSGTAHRLMDHGEPFLGGAEISNIHNEAPNYTKLVGERAEDGTAVWKVDWELGNRIAKNQRSAEDKKSARQTVENQTAGVAKERLIKEAFAAKNIKIPVREKSAIAYALRSHSRIYQQVNDLLLRAMGSGFITIVAESKKKFGTRYPDIHAENFRVVLGGKITTAEELEKVKHGAKEILEYYPKWNLTPEDIDRMFVLSAIHDDVREFLAASSLFDQIIALNRSENRDARYGVRGTGSGRSELRSKQDENRPIWFDLDKPTPDWQRKNAMVWVYLESKRAGETIEMDSLKDRMAAKLKQMELGIDSDNLNRLWAEIESTGILNNDREAALGSDAAFHIRAQLLESLDDAGKLETFLKEYDQAAATWPLYPLESRWPVLRAVALMEKSDQEKLVQQLIADPARFGKLRLVDTILLMLGEELLLPEVWDAYIEKWMEVHTPSLIGRNIYYVSPETWLLAGGLGRVGQYHARAVHKLLAKHGRIITIEPFYHEKIHPDGHRTPIDYGKLETPVEHLENAYEFDVLVAGKKVPVVVKKGLTKEGIPSFLLDGGMYYTPALYKYGSQFKSASWEEFSEFFARASLELIRLRENKIQTGKRNHHHPYKAPIIWGNDGQSGFLPAYKRILDRVEKTLRRAYVFFVTHTFRNRGYYGEHDAFLEKAGLRYPPFHGLSWNVDRNQRDVTSIGVNGSDDVAAVSAAHRHDVSKNDPHAREVSIPNGDTLEKSAAYFRKILLQFFPQVDVWRPTGEQILKAKAAGIHQLNPKLKEKWGVELNPKLPVISYTGRFVAEKSGVHGPFTTHNIRELIMSGSANVAYFGNVQNHPDNDFESLKEEARRINEDAEAAEKVDGVKKGRVIVATGWDLNDQVEILGISHILVLASDFKTEASGITEANITANFGLILGPPYTEGNIQKIGVVLDPTIRGSGNIIIPEKNTPQAYLDKMLGMTKMFRENLDLFGSFLEVSGRLSRVVNALEPGSEYLLQLEEGVRRKDNLEKLSELLESNQSKLSFSNDLKKELEHISKLTREEAVNLYGEEKLFALMTTVVFFDPTALPRFQPWKLEEYAMLERYVNDPLNAPLFGEGAVVRVHKTTNPHVFQFSRTVKGTPRILVPTVYLGNVPWDQEDSKIWADVEGTSRLIPKEEVDVVFRLGDYSIPDKEVFFYEKWPRGRELLAGNRVGIPIASYFSVGANTKHLGLHTQLLFIEAEETRLKREQAQAQAQIAQTESPAAASQPAVRSELRKVSRHLQHTWFDKVTKTVTRGMFGIALAMALSPIFSSGAFAAENWFPKKGIDNAFNGPRLAAGSGISARPTQTSTNPFAKKPISTVMNSNGTPVSFKLANGESVTTNDVTFSVTSPIEAEKKRVEANRRYGHSNWPPYFRPGQVDYWPDKPTFRRFNGSTKNPIWTELSPSEFSREEGLGIWSTELIKNVDTKPLGDRRYRLLVSTLDLIGFFPHLLGDANREFHFRRWYQAVFPDKPVPHFSSNDMLAYLKTNTQAQLAGLQATEKYFAGLGIVDNPVPGNSQVLYWALEQYAQSVMEDQRRLPADAIVVVDHIVTASYNWKYLPNGHLYVYYNADFLEMQPPVVDQSRPPIVPINEANGLRMGWGKPLSFDLFDAKLPSLSPASVLKKVGAAKAVRDRFGSFVVTGGEDGALRLHYSHDEHETVALRFTQGNVNLDEFRHELATGNRTLDRFILKKMGLDAKTVSKATDAQILKALDELLSQEDLYAWISANDSHRWEQLTEHAWLLQRVELFHGDLQAARISDRTGNRPRRVWSMFDPNNPSEDGRWRLNGYGRGVLARALLEMSYSGIRPSPTEMWGRVTPLDGIDRTRLLDAAVIQARDFITIGLQERAGLDGGLDRRVQKDAQLYFVIALAGGAALIPSDVKWDKLLAEFEALQKRVDAAKKNKKSLTPDDAARFKILGLLRKTAINRNTISQWHMAAELTNAYIWELPRGVSLWEWILKRNKDGSSRHLSLSEMWRKRAELERLFPGAVNPNPLTRFPHLLQQLVHQHPDFTEDETKLTSGERVRALASLRQWRDFVAAWRTIIPETPLPEFTKKLFVLDNPRHPVWVDAKLRELLAPSPQMIQRLNFIVNNPAERTRVYLSVWDTVDYPDYIKAVLELAQKSRGRIVVIFYPSGEFPFDASLVKPENPPAHKTANRSELRIQRANVQNVRAAVESVNELVQDWQKIRTEVNSDLLLRSAHFLLGAVGVGLIGMIFKGNTQMLIWGIALLPTLISILYFADIVPFQRAQSANQLLREVAADSSGPEKIEVVRNLFKKLKLSFFPRARDSGDLGVRAIDAILLARSEMRKAVPRFEPKQLHSAAQEYSWWLPRESLSAEGFRQGFKVGNANIDFGRGIGAVLGGSESLSVPVRDLNGEVFIVSLEKHSSAPGGVWATIRDLNVDHSGRFAKYRSADATKNELIASHQVDPNWPLNYHGNPWFRMEEQNRMIVTKMATLLESGVAPEIVTQTGINMLQLWVQNRQFPISESDHIAFRVGDHMSFSRPAEVASTPAQVAAQLNNLKGAKITGFPNPIRINAIVGRSTRYPLLIIRVGDERTAREIKPFDAKALEEVLRDAVFYTARSENRGTRDAKLSVSSSRSETRSVEMSLYDLEQLLTAAGILKKNSLVVQQPLVYARVTLEDGTLVRFYRKDGKLTTDNSDWEYYMRQSPNQKFNITTLSVEYEGGMWSGWDQKFKSAISEKYVYLRFQGSYFPKVPARQMPISGIRFSVRSEMRKLKPMKDILPELAAAAEQIKLKLGFDIEGGFSYPSEPFAQVVVRAFDNVLPEVIRIISSNAEHQAESISVPPGISKYVRESLAGILADLEKKASGWKDNADVKDRHPQLIYAADEIQRLIKRIDDWVAERPRRSETRLVANAILLVGGIAIVLGMVKVIVGVQAFGLASASFPAWVKFLTVIFAVGVGLFVVKKIGDLFFLRRAPGVNENTATASRATALHSFLTEKRFVWARQSDHDHVVRITHFGISEINFGVKTKQELGVQRVEHQTNGITYLYLEPDVYATFVAVRRSEMRDTSKKSALVTDLDKKAAWFWGGPFFLGLKLEIALRAFLGQEGKEIFAIIKQIKLSMRWKYLFFSILYDKITLRPKELVTLLKEVKTLTNVVQAHPRSLIYSIELSDAFESGPSKVFRYPIERSLDGVLMLANFADEALTMLQLLEKVVEKDLSIWHAMLFIKAIKENPEIKGQPDLTDWIQKMTPHIIEFLIVGHDPIINYEISSEEIAQAVETMRQGIEMGRSIQVVPHPQNAFVNNPTVQLAPARVVSARSETRKKREEAQTQAQAAQTTNRSETRAFFNVGENIVPTITPLAKSADEQRVAPVTQDVSRVLFSTVDAQTRLAREFLGGVLPLSVFGQFGNFVAMASFATQVIGTVVFASETPAPVKSFLEARQANTQWSFTQTTPTSGMAQVALHPALVEAILQSGDGRAAFELLKQFSSDAKTDIAPVVVFSANSDLKNIFFHEMTKHGSGLTALEKAEAVELLKLLQVEFVPAGVSVESAIKTYVQTYGKSWGIAVLLPNAKLLSQIQGALAVALRTDIAGRDSVALARVARVLQQASLLSGDAQALFLHNTLPGITRNGTQWVLGSIQALLAQWIANRQLISTSA